MLGNFVHGSILKLSETSDETKKTVKTEVRNVTK